MYSTTVELHKASQIQLSTSVVIYINAYSLCDNVNQTNSTSLELVCQLVSIQFCNEILFLIILS